MAQRPYDIIVWGATGFTGRLVAKYLVQRNAQASGPADKVAFALAGRNESALQQVRSSLEELSEEAKDVGVLVGDATEQKSLDRVVSSGKVLLTTAGPYAKIGSPVVEACVRLGTDYCDITGETAWVRDMIDKHHDLAVRNKVLVINCCGFDSLPADLGVFMTVDHITSKMGERPTHLQGFYKLRGGVSGGTIASLMGMLEDPTAMQRMKEPFLLNPKDDQQPKVASKLEKEQTSVAHNKGLGVWGSPFIMAQTNTRIVRRSAALLRYDGGFSYNESMEHKYWIGAVLAVIAMAFAMLLLRFSPSRKLLKKVLPKPGEGPSEKKMREGFMVYRVIGKTDKGHYAIGKVKGGEPGYLQTSKMLAECAICILRNKGRFPHSGGFVTPATMGHFLIDQFNSTEISGLKLTIVPDS